MKRWYPFICISAADLLFILNLKFESTVINVLIIVILSGMAVISLIKRMTSK